MIHQYNWAATTSCWTCSGSVHVVDEVAYDAIALYRGAYPGR